jgi:hypothetical protein
MALSKVYEFKLQYTNNRSMYDNDFLSHFPQIEPSIEKTVTIESAYIMVSRLEGSKEMLKFYISIYENASKEFLITSKEYEFTPSVEDGSENFIKQAYEHLKALPEYADAIDC